MSLKMLAKNYIFFSLGHSLHAQSLLTSIIQEYADGGFRQTFQLGSMFALLFAYLVNAREYSYYGMRRIYSSAYFVYAGTLSEGGCGCGSQSTLAARLSAGRSAEKAYRKEYGELCKRSRLQEALKLLADPDLNIYQIAENCGFAGVEEFTLSSGRGSIFHLLNTGSSFCRIKKNILPRFKKYSHFIQSGR